jgi:hypothetical protein
MIEESRRRTTGRLLPVRNVFNVCVGVPIIDRNAGTGRPEVSRDAVIESGIDL